MAILKTGGFTLIELLTVVTVMSIMLFLALPNFSVWLHNTQIRTAGEAILSGLQLARTEAVRRNVNVELTLDLTPGSSGWTAKIAGVGGEVIQSRLTGEGSASAFVTITPNGARTITFTSFGTTIATNADGSNTITELKIDAPSLAAADSRELCILVRTGGTIRMCDPQVLATDTRTCVPPLPAPQVVPTGCT
jgi:type IV fimbrial biogenesis protein FimT